MGVSRATVTHVLNGRATEQRIHPDTQKRVLEAARELGYRPNAAARAIRSGKFGSVALIQSQLGQYLPSELLHGLTSAIVAQDMLLVLTQIANIDAAGDSYVAQTMRELSVDGVFVNRHGGAPPAYLDRIVQLRIPAVFLNSQQEFDAIYPDDQQGGEMATTFLLSLQHERVAYVESELRRVPHYSEADRRFGYQRAMVSAGKAPWVHQLPVDWRQPGGGNEDRRVEAALQLLNRPDRPTAVLAYEFAESMAVVRAALTLGIRIPEDLSLIQFHNRIDPGAFIPVHTVSNMMQQVGENAVGMLLEKIARPDAAVPSKAITEVLIEGDSCLPLRRN